MRIWDRRQSVVSAVISAVIFLLLSHFIWESEMAFWHIGWALLSALLFYYLSVRKFIKRRSLAHQVFPPAWRDILQNKVPYYRRLSPKDKARFETNVLIFLNENKITGIDVDVTDEIRLLVASSAVMLIFGRDDWEYTVVPEILIYPESFDEDFNTTSPAYKRHITGMVAPQNAIIFSKPALYKSFSNPGSGFHVGLHEFAHLLDMEQWRTDGVPRDLNRVLERPWINLVVKEMTRVRENRSMLREYAGQDEAEFFAVAVEYFFEKPLALKEHHTDLYDMFCSFFNQDPARNQSA